MSDDPQKINFGLIDLEVNKRVEKNKSRYDFQNALDRMKRQVADEKTKKIHCPFCKSYFDPNVMILRDHKDDELLAHCPHCESILKRYRKNLK